MAERMSELLQEYDELAEAVENSTHQFYEANLASWFSFIDETPEFARLVAQLEKISDFDAWYNQAELMHQSGGMGPGDLNFPADRAAALGIKISIFRRMAERKIHAALFAHTFISGDRNLNVNVSELSEQLFRPTVRELRRRLSQGASKPDVPPVTLPSATTGQIPASDRIVPIDHNSTDYADVIEQLDKLEELIRAKNDYPDSDDDHERQIAEIKATKQVIIAPNAREHVLFALVRDGLTYFVKKFADISIGKVAAAILGLIGKITGLW